MTARRDPDRLIGAFLSEGEELLSDSVYDAVRAEIDQTRQHRAGFGPWRFPTMNRFMAVGAGAVAVLAILVAGAQLFGAPSGTDGPADPTATVEPSATPPASAAASTTPPMTPLSEGPFVWVDPAASVQPDWFDPEFDDGPPITVEIPAPGWVFTDSFNLLKGGEVDGLFESALLWTSTTHGVLVYGDPCEWRASVPEVAATTADEIVTALAAQPGRDASDPVDLTIGGYDAKRITLRVPDDATFTACDGGQFASFTLEGYDGGPWRAHDGPGQIDTFWVVEVDGAIVIIDGMYRPDTSASDVEEMRSIAESATFEAP